ncbi:MAG: glycosyltransferase family 9 protein [Cyclobacteriaceae bacterium]
MKKILVLRFSGMGDLALMVPVLRSLVAAHQHIQVTVVTQPRFAFFFQNIDRVTVFEADIDEKFAGFFGVRQLFRALFLTKDFDVVIDLHNHIRTIVLRNLFKVFGRPVFALDKGGKEKKAFSRKEKKITRPLPHQVERYQKVFEKAGYSFQLLKPPYLIPSDESKKLVEGWFVKKGLKKNEKWIGLAPFARHKTKIWPTANYPKLIDALIKKIPVKFFLYGSGDEEIKYFEDLQQLFPEHIVMVAGRLKLPQETTLMTHLDLMVCVDSSTMHLATMVNTPVLSIWGGSHPDVGWAPFGKGEESIVQISRVDIACRPCSVYGKETCFRGDFACLNWITPEMVTERVIGRIDEIK